MMRRLWGILLALGAFAPGWNLTAQPSKEAAHGWFKEAGYGVFVHFLGGGDDWNSIVNSFDAGRFADQLQGTGAKYLIFTLGQNSGFYCSPNSVYDRYTGYQPGQRCSRRDLPRDLINALSDRGIRLMLYLPSRAPQEDLQAIQGLGDVDERQPAPQEFTRRWSEVIREWSNRYGAGLAGWWFDGAYNTAGWDDPAAPHNWRTWAEATRTGNTSSILAFNRGAEIRHAFIRQTDQQDYTAGEQNDFVATPASNPAPAGQQWHLLAHLGSRWAAADGPRRSPEYLQAYLAKVLSQGGVVTFEVHCSYTGEIYRPHLDALTAVGEALEKAR